MSLNSIEKEIRNHWQQAITSTTDICDLETHSELYISILKSLEVLQSKSKPLDNVDATDDDNDKKAPEVHRSISDYIFYRRVRGGIGKQSSESEEVVEKIPESVIREENLETGDTVKIEKNYYGTNKHRYSKQPFEKVEIDEIDYYPIIEYNNAIVSFDNTLKQYVIKSYSSSEGIKSSPVMLIHNDDIERLNLQEGYIVDVACIPDRNLVRVRWSYKTNVVHTNKPNKSSFYKDNTEKTDVTIESNIKDKQILVVGGNSNINRYTEEVDKRGGSLVSTLSDREVMIKHLIDNSDIVVIPIFETSHIKMKIAKAYCIARHVPYLILEKSGRSHFISEIENIINNNE
ncbi:DUF2325 domain-containing protein [Staphylococcus equorum]|uniref:DUF2325 domain-containing protein n=1 Tax=Staphylococcus equorum TaxID=246432 RepID=A0AAP7IF27_9STAP|nr:DUF2325 domain-containing protein [Staphylococcus equorum]OEK58900.1 hypothetical protein ASS94_00835 [Staphylococcus equorum]